MRNTRLANESAGSTWQIKRRGVVYTVQVTECAIDDPKAGFPPIDPSPRRPAAP